MSLREEMMDLKLKELMKREDQYEFPLFMRLVRKTLGLSRKSVAETLAVSESKMYYLEDGKFVRGPDPEFIASLAHYYGLNGRFIMKKFGEYTREKCKAAS